jgi:GTP-binding protein EngB required for normal cell division
MYKFLEELELPKCIVLSKVDRLSNNEIKKSFDHSQEIFFGQKIIPISTFKNM